MWTCDQHLWKNLQNEGKMHMGSSLKEEKCHCNRTNSAYLFIYFKLVAFSGVNSDVLNSAHFLLCEHLSKWLKQS